MEEIARAVGGPKTVCAVTSQGSISLGAGHIRHTGMGMTSVASFQPQQSNAPAFARILRKAGIPTEVLEDATTLVWGKLIVNAAINPVTAIWNVPNGEILKRPNLKETAFAAANEAVAVAQAKGVRLPFADAAEEVTKVCQATAANLSSMLQDVRNGKQTEIESISGAIVREARSAKVRVPVNKMFLAKARKFKRAKIAK
jgi:2-dehydropantoate 2-reductase